MTINASLALNSLSFGFCSYHILSEFQKRGLEVNLFPIGGNTDTSAFDKATPELKSWTEDAIRRAPSSYSRNNPGFKLWHIAGSEASESRDNHLFVFHELDSLTPIEVNILNNQKKIFVSSNYTKQVFERNGVKTPIVFIPLGFDSQHFSVVQKRYYKEDVVVWSIFGKLEHRKRHAKTIRAWLNKYGNNPKHMLHLHVYNNFLKPEDNNAEINKIFQGQRFTNVNLIGYTKTLSELNECYNATNIVIDMSGAEGWSLPGFTCVGLGKHAVVHNVTAMKDWATSQNAVLVEPTSKIPVYDGIFFRSGNSINQGNIFDYAEPDFYKACDEALARYQQTPINLAGLALQNKFTWKNTVDQILANIEQ